MKEQKRMGLPGWPHPLLLRLTQVSAARPVGVTGPLRSCGMPAERFSALLEAARTGSEEAWTSLYRSLAPAVLGYVRANHGPDPEDTMSEVFLQVARDLPGFEGDEPKFRAWVFTIAHHRLIDARRHSARRPVEPVAELPEPDYTVVSDAAEQALERIGAEEVQRVLEALSPDQRAVLLLRIVGDLTIADVADVLGKRQGAIKQLQRRGLAAVKRELTKKGVTL
jgi:RNA polymerase sigma-70 factor, ECF subfamily